VIIAGAFGLWLAELISNALLARSGLQPCCSSCRVAPRGQLIVIGLIAHACADATVRSAVDLGYRATVVKDATASYSDERMRAALEINIPN
jgi:isochorismate hydrolase